MGIYPGSTHCQKVFLESIQLLLGSKWGQEVQVECCSYNLCNSASGRRSSSTTTTFQPTTTIRSNKVNDGGSTRPGWSAVTPGGTSTEAERLTTEEGKRLITEQFEEQKRFMAEQFEEQRRFNTKQFEKYFE